MSPTPLLPGARHRQLQSEVEELEQTLLALAAELARLGGDMETLATSIPRMLDTMRGEVSQVAPSIHANLDAVRGEVSQVAPSIHADLDALRGEVSQVALSIHANLDALRGEVAQLRAEVAALRGETEGFRTETEQMLNTRSTPGVSRAMTRPLAGEMFARLLPDEVVLNAVAPGWRDFVAEYMSVAAELSERYRTTKLALPPEYAVEALTSKLLYVIVRAVRPATVLETGVANGHSTFVLLTALERNGSGQLHSTDISDDVGGLLDTRQRSGWHYHKIPLTGSRRAFSALLASLPPVDLFLHDSDHSYTWQRFEYESVSEHLPPHGLIVSDDVDASYAFLDFCEVSGQRPLLVYDSRKIIGLVQHESQ